MTETDWEITTGEYPGMDLVRCREALARLAVIHSPNGGELDHVLDNNQKRDMLKSTSEGENG